MAELILVRHGQANSHATDEESYDRLSDLGHQQAGWLGEHMRATNPQFDRVLTGRLSRQQDTARAMGYDGLEVDERLDELQYFALAEALESQFGIPAPQEPTEFARHLPEVMDHWSRDLLPGVPERFADFSARVNDLVDEICAGHGRVLAVTSGGVIGMTVRHILGLQNGGLSKIMLQVMNSSMHRVDHVHGITMLGSFNAVPHLDAPDRAHARTHV